MNLPWDCSLGYKIDYELTSPLFSHNLFELFLARSLLVGLYNTFDLGIVIVHAKNPHRILDGIERCDDAVIAINDFLNSQVVDGVLNLLANLDYALLLVLRDCKRFSSATSWFLLLPIIDWISLSFCAASTIFSCVFSFERE